jgi:hypothetical protein
MSEVDEDFIVPEVAATVVPVLPVSTHFDPSHLPTRNAAGVVTEQFEGISHPIVMARLELPEALSSDQYSQSLTVTSPGPNVALKVAFADDRKY